MSGLPTGFATHATECLCFVCSVMAPPCFMDSDQNALELCICVFVSWLLILNILNGYAGVYFLGYLGLIYFLLIVFSLASDIWAVIQRVITLHVLCLNMR